MLVFCDEKYSMMGNFSGNNIVVLNLSNPIERGIMLNNLIPPFHPMDSKDFDIFYANYIMTNDLAFIDFMKIIYSLYEGKLVYILVSHDEYRDLLTESLLKFIQQRYGIIGNIINEEEDWIYAQDSTFNIQGIYNLDIDKERFSFLVTNFNELQKSLGMM